MKKILLILMSFLFALNSYSQITKIERIAIEPMVSIQAVLYLDEKGNQTKDPVFFLSGQNYEYNHIDDIVVIAGGTPQDIYNILKPINIFLDNNKDKTRITYEIKELKMEIYHYKDFGVGKMIVTRNGKGVYIFDKAARKLQRKLIEYCKKKNIEIQL